jgi:hypothetical protein
VETLDHRPLLDYRALSSASGIIGGALLTLLAIQIQKSYPGFVRIVVGMEILAVAIVVGGLRGHAPEAFLAIQITAVSSFALIDGGLRLFCAAPRRGRWPSVYVLASMLLRTVRVRSSDSGGRRGTTFSVFLLSHAIANQEQTSPDAAA